MSLINTDPLGGDFQTNVYRTVTNGAPWKSDMGGGSPVGSGMPVLPGMGGGPEEMKMNEIMKMILLNGAASGQPLFSMNFGKGKGVRVGGGGGGMGGGVSAGGAAGNMDLMKLLAMVQMMKGQQGTRPGPARGGQQAGPPQ